MTYSPICLDITRLVSRVGLGALSGVDRVEQAYLTWVLENSENPQFLCRTTRGYLLFDRKGGESLSGLVDGTIPLGQADVLSRLLGKASKARHRAEGSLRPLKIASSLPRNLSGLLAKHLPANTVYVNVGHSNLSARTLGTFASHGARIAVMIHDLIPLQYPDLVAEGSTARFEKLMSNVAAHADLIIANSIDTKQHVRDYLGDVAIPIQAAHLGMVKRARAREIPITAPTDRPYFVSLGTIEPRKNHAVLLDVWDALAREMPSDDLPYLHIIGRRGWKNEEILNRLDQHPLKGKVIFEHGALPDAQTRALISGSKALLFPSLAEGFGYPPLEALEDGVLPVCSALPVLKETLGDSAVYVKGGDAYSWTNTIKQLYFGTVPAKEQKSMTLPTWDAHFAVVNAALLGIGTDA